MREGGHRHARLEDLLLEELMSIVPLEMHDPRAVTAQVTRLQLSPDMKNCRVFVISTENSTVPAEMLEVLNHAVPFIREQVALNLSLKHTPKFQFYFDTAHEKAMRVEDIFRRLEAGEPGDEEPPPARE